MKKLVGFFVFLAMAFSLVGCSPKKTSIPVAEDVDFKLVDVLAVENENVNTAYYYFLASVENNSDKVYHMSNLSYKLMAKSGSEYKSINPIDQFKTIISNDVISGMSTYIYGYIGVPKTSDRNIGLYVEGQDEFIPFDSVKIRNIKDENVKNSSESKFIVYSDEFYEFEVDASNLSYHYANGKSSVEGLKINYKNKSDKFLVVPFLSPVCTIDGLKISSLTDADKLKTMSQEEISKQNFSQNDMEAKTESFKAETYGYQLFYLDAQQELSVNVLFEAEDVIPDFSAKQKNGITISINSPALGYRQNIKVPY